MKSLLRMATFLILIVSLFPVPVQGAISVQAQLCSQEAGAAGCVDLTLAPAGLLGDVYVDGTLIASQVGSTRLSLVPGTPHLIEVKNITEAAEGFGDVFNYGDVAKANVQVGVGKVQALTLKATRNYLKGYVKFTCDIKGAATGQAVQCQVSAGGAALGALNPGESGQWALTNGPRTLHVDLLGANADLWAPATSDHPVTIVGGKTANLKATYNRKGQLTINTHVVGLVGDFYVDGVLIAGQVSEAVTFVAAGNHTVEGKNFTDPAANGVYMYADATGKGTVAANQSRVVTLKPAKVFLMGFAEVSCGIKAIEPGQDVRCTVTADGQGLGTVEAGQKQSFNLAVGAHTLNVALSGNDAGIWSPAARDLPVNVVAGKPAKVNPTFDRKAILEVALSDPAMVGDIYVDGVLIAGQVNAAWVTVEPGVAHMVEARALANIQDNRWAYDDLAQTVKLGANQTKSVVLKVGKGRDRRGAQCDPAYPDVCIPPAPPDLDCGQVPYKNFRVLPPDPHKFDRDHDGIGCES